MKRILFSLFPEWRLSWLRKHGTAEQKLKIKVSEFRMLMGKWGYDLSDVSDQQILQRIHFFMELNQMVFLPGMEVMALAMKNEISEA